MVASAIFSQRVILCAAAAFMLLAIACEVGESPIAPPVKKGAPLDTPLDSVLSLGIATGGIELTYGSDTTFEIEAILVNGNRNPVAGKAILFSASGGVITISDTTDSQGIATAMMRYVASDPDSIVVLTARVQYGDSLLSTSAQISVAHEFILPDSVNGNMQIRTNPSQVAAAYGEKATVEVMVFDNSRNPIIGKKIMFGTTRGTITASGSTDSTGTAYATFYGEPVNGNAVVTGKMRLNDSDIVVATTITLSGIAVVVVPQLSVAPPGSSIPVLVKLLDGKGNPLPDREIRFNSGKDSVKLTDGNGEIETAVSRATEGRVVVRAFALGAGDSTEVYFGNTAPVDIDNTVRSLRLFVSHPQLRADNSAEAIVTAVLISEDNHNPLVGDTIEFSATLGIIDRIGITDSSGRTSVTLRSAPVNGLCMIRAVQKGNAALKDSTSVLLSGVTLSLSADRDDIRINDTASITALLKDGSGNPISSDDVTFAIKVPGIFSDGSRLVKAPLSSVGSVIVMATSSTAGPITIHAASANVTDSIVLTFTTNNLSLTGAKTRLTIGGDDSTKLSARYVDASGNPIGEKTISFATSAGTVVPKTATTGNDGIAETYLKSGFFSATAMVQAKSDDGSAYCEVEFLAAMPRQISLAITPDNIGINGGIAELIATVKDDSGNVVSGVEVSFRIVKGPGGGETIDKPIIVSTNDGIARAHLMAGALPSEYRGCEVEAMVAAYSVSSKLTISGEPHTVTVSRPEDDTVKVPDGGIRDESTFEVFIGAVVKDVNGNPVADGTPVNFSALVTGMAVGLRTFVRFETTLGDVEPLYDYAVIDIPFEDINNNFRYDAGIDLDIDWYHTIAARGDDRNGNGVMEYDYLTDGICYDFNNNDTCDISNDNPSCEPYYEASMKIGPDGDTTYEIFADLNRNGIWDRNECNATYRSRFPSAMFTSPMAYDFEFWRWEMRPQFYGKRLDFTNNDFAVVVDRTAVTKDGVAYTRLTYPRQLALRLYATVNAEVKGIRDRDGERFILPIIR